MIIEDLKNIAKIKLKLDALTELYKIEQDKLKDKIGKEKGAADPDNILKVNIVTKNNRTFFPDKVKEVLGDKAEICIEEKVDTKKFDALVKDNKGNYTLSKEDQDKCFSVREDKSMTWEGLEVYKNKLIEESERTKNASIKG